MGIFGSQGEYAKLAPLFVDKFDTEPTFSKINKGYSDFDELSKINATNALNYEQFEANSITGKYQKALQQVDAGEISPFKAVRLAKETAHAYVNDPIRRNYEMSKMNDDLSMKENQGKQSTYGARELAHAKWLNEGGGSGTKYLNQWSASKDLSLADIATKVAANANEDSKGQAGWVVDKANGKIVTTGTSREWLSKDKVYNNTLQVVNADPEINKFLEETSYGELYDRMNASLINNPETANLPEKARKALIYQQLTAPRRTEKKDKAGNVIVDTRSYLQRQVDAKKQNVVAGIAGLKAYEKTDMDVKFDSLPEGDGGKTDPASLLASGAALPNTMDVESPFSENYQSKTNELIGDATSNTGAIGRYAGYLLSTKATGVSNAAKNIMNVLSYINPYGGSTLDLKQTEMPEYKDKQTKFNESLPIIQKEFEKAGIKYDDIPKLKSDGSNIQEIYDKLNTKSQQVEAINRFKYRMPAAVLTDPNLSQTLRRSNLDQTEILVKNDNGLPTKIKFKEVADSDKFNVAYDSKLKTEAQKIKEVQNNMKVSEMVSLKGQLYYRASYGGKEMYIPVEEEAKKNAGRTLVKLEELYKADFSNGKASVDLDASDVFARRDGYTKLIKTVTPSRDNPSNVVLSYRYEGPGVKPSRNYTTGELAEVYANYTKALLQGTEAMGTHYSSKNP